MKEEYIVVFEDELSGGYGYWTYELEEEARNALDGEKYLQEVYVGMIPECGIEKFIEKFEGERNYEK